MKWLRAGAEARSQARGFRIVLGLRGEPLSKTAKINVEHLVGAEVGTSTILKELARGGMAIVFVAYQRTLKRQIALKFCLGAS